MANAISSSKASICRLPSINRHTTAKSSVEPSTTAKMAPKRKHDEFLTDVKSLLDTGKFSDFTITCQGREWKVHKAIVCTQSDVLEAASKFGKEAGEAKIDLPDDDPEIVEYMLRFMYERDYRLPSNDEPGPHWVYCECGEILKGLSITHQEEAREKQVRIYECSVAALQVLREHYPGLLEEQSGAVFFVNLCVETPNLVKELVSMPLEYYDRESNTYRQSSRPPTGDLDLSIHTKIYGIADKYFVKGLKQLVRENFRECLENSFAGWSFYQAVNLIFTTTPDTDTGLRDLAAERVSEEKRKYRLCFNMDLKTALKDIPGLAYMVLSYEDMRRQDAEFAEV